MAVTFSVTSLALLLGQPTTHSLIPRATSEPPLAGNNGWNDMKSCVRNCIDAPSDWPDVWLWSGCSTHSCLCRADTFSSILVPMSSCISSKCEDNPLDQASATSYFGSYCSMDIDAATSGNTRMTGSTTITISRTIFTTDGATVTSNSPPIVTVVSVGSPQFNNIINNGNGNGNSGNGNGNANTGRSLRISSLLMCALGLSSFLAALVVC